MDNCPARNVVKYPTLMLYIAAAAAVVIYRETLRYLTQAMVP